MTELECCVLGTVWQTGEATAYEIARPFAESASSYWSGSAGAIYPLVKRLEEKRLLRGRTVEWNARKKRVFSLTKAGEAALREWLTPPFPPSAGAASFDPIRTRVFFLDALSPELRRLFATDAERVVREQLGELEERYQREVAEGRTLEALATRGGLHELRARLRWLREVRKEFAP